MRIKKLSTSDLEGINILSRSDIKNHIKINNSCFISAIKKQYELKNNIIIFLCKDMCVAFDVGKYSVPYELFNTIKIVKGTYNEFLIYGIYETDSWALFDSHILEANEMMDYFS